MGDKRRSRLSCYVELHNVKIHNGCNGDWNNKYYPLIELNTFIIMTLYAIRNDAIYFITKICFASGLLLLLFLNEKKYMPGFICWSSSSVQSHFISSILFPILSP